MPKGFHLVVLRTLAALCCLAASPARAQDADDVIERRLKRSFGEIAMWGEYDYVILNDDFDLAYADLAHIYHAERLRRSRNPWLKPFVQKLLDEPL